MRGAKWSEAVVGVLVCEESAVARRRLIVALEASPDIEVIAEADDSDAVLEQVRSAAPDVVWLDVRLSGIGAIRLTASILEVVPAARVVVMTGADDLDARRRALKAGAVGVVDRDRAGADAAAVTRRVAWGRCHLHPADVAVLVETYASFARHARSRQQQVRPPTLDAVQRHVLERLAAGATAAEVSVEVGLAPASIDNLVGDAVAVLHRHSRAEALSYAVEGRLFDAPRPSATDPASGLDQAGRPGATSPARHRPPTG